MKMLTYIGVRSLVDTRTLKVDKFMTSLVNNETTHCNTQQNHMMTLLTT
jgi:hypothetical protein